MSGPRQGFLLIADITGYTRYLTESELDHAQGVLQALMELLIDHTKPPLVVSGLQGDAVLSYGIDSASLGGQTFVEMIEDTYVAFRRAIELMVLNTTCSCNACANISALDLKFFVHHGTFTVHRVGGGEELLGPDVIAIHRLTKNRVVETTGVSAYTLYTAAAIRRIGLDGFTGSLVPHHESYDDIGAIDVWIQDMHPTWEAKRDTVHPTIAEDDVLVRIDGEIPVPVSVMWELLTRPEYRAIFVHSKRQELLAGPDGRMGEGSVYRCYHGGGKVTTQTVLDWQPFVRILTEDTTPVPKTTVLVDMAIEPFGGGTRVSATSSKARGPWLQRTVCNAVGRRVIKSSFSKGLDTLRGLVERQIADGTLHVPAETDVSGEHVSAAVSASLTSGP